MVLLKSIQKKSHSTQSRAVKPRHTQSRFPDGNKAIDTSANSTNVEGSNTKDAKNTRTTDREQASSSHNPSNGERLEELSLSLLVPDESQHVDSTGSVLLDSLSKNHARETVALRNLSLIEISTSQLADQRHAEQTLQSRSKLPKPLCRSSSYDTALSGASKGSTVVKAALPRVRPPRTQATEAQLTQAHISKVQLFQTQQIQTQQTQTQSSKAQSFKTQSSKTQPSQAQQTESAYSPQTSVPSAKPRRKTAHPIDDGRAARASAASVGLLDIDDTLLFGGAHGEISLVDSYATQVAASEVYILAYLSQHMSSLTVAQPQDGFLKYTHFCELNRPDLSRYQTVLDIGSFQLSGLGKYDRGRNSQSAHVAQLVRVDAEPRLNGQSIDDQSTSNQSTDDQDIETQNIDALSAQIRELNTQMEYLRKQLDRVAVA